MKITDYTVVCNGDAERAYGSDVLKSAQSGVIFEGKTPAVCLRLLMTDCHSFSLLLVSTFYFLPASSWHSQENPQFVTK